MKKYHYPLFVLIVVLAIPAMAFFSGVFKEKDRDLAFEKAKVLEIVESNLSEDTVIEGIKLGHQQLHVEILTGPHSGEKFYIKNPLSRLYNIEARESMTLIVRIAYDAGQIIAITVFNHHRTPMIYLLVGVFFSLLCLLGGLKGLRAALSLVFTGALIVFFMLPMLFKGHSAIGLAVVTVTITTIVSLLLVSHWGYKTLAAIIGTVSGVLIAGVIAFAVGEMSRLSGITMNEAEELIFIAGDRGIKVKGLMFAAILIASLGAVMDVAMSIASSVFEISEQNPSLSQRALWTSGMNVGKDVMGTMANTLILAFAGGSLNVMILIAAYQMPYHQLMNLDFVGTEMVLGLSGSIGIVLTVPITAWTASLLAKRSKKTLGM